MEPEKQLNTLNNAAHMRRRTEPFPEIINRTSVAQPKEGEGIGSSCVSKIPALQHGSDTEAAPAYERPSAAETPPQQRNGNDGSRNAARAEDRTPLQAKRTVTADPGLGDQEQPRYTATTVSGSSDAGKQEHATVSGQLPPTVGLTKARQTAPAVDMPPPRKNGTTPSARVTVAERPPPKNKKFGNNGVSHGEPAVDTGEQTLGPDPPPRHVTLHRALSEEGTPRGLPEIAELSPQYGTRPEDKILVRLNAFSVLVQELEYPEQSVAISYFFVCTVSRHIKTIRGRNRKLIRSAEVTRIPKSGHLTPSERLVLGIFLPEVGGRYRDTS